MPRQYPYRLPTYNGFSHEERVATNPVQRAAAQRGEFRFPDTCSICGFSDPPNIRTSGYIFAHLEDYRRPLECLPCCKRCHAALHARFLEPQRWLTLVARHAGGGEWFTKLTMDANSQTLPYDKIYPQNWFE